MVSKMNKKLDSNRISIQVEGSINDNGLVRVSDFTAKLNTLLEIISKLDKLVGRSVVPSLYAVIYELRLSSPSLVGYELKTIKSHKDHREAVVNKFFEGLSFIEKGDVPLDYDSDILQSYKKLGSGQRQDGKKDSYLNEIICYSGDVRIKLSQSFERKVDNIIGEDEIADGTASGILEYLNIHGNKNVFNIYPTAGARQVKCHFPPPLKPKVIQAVDRYVNVIGKLRYKKRDNFPYSMDVEELEISPPENELPTLFDLLGMAPNATGELSSEEFIRKIRDEWR